MEDKIFTYRGIGFIEGLDRVSSADIEWFNEYSEKYNNNQSKLRDKNNTNNDNTSNISWTLNDDLTITIILTTNRRLTKTETKKFNDYIEDINKYTLGNEFRNKYEYMHKNIGLSRRKIYLTLIDDSEPVGYAVKQFENSKTEYYKAFMYDITNEFNCIHCPENADRNGKFPCGQQNCWVTAHCKSN